MRGIPYSSKAIKKTGWLEVLFAREESSRKGFLDKRKQMHYGRKVKYSNLFNDSKTHDNVVLIILIVGIWKNIGIWNAIFDNNFAKHLFKYK